MFFVLNSAKYKILNALMYQIIKQFSFFSGENKPRMLFFLLTYVKMPKFVGILTFMCRKISWSAELSMKNICNLEIRLAL